ncbi:MAG: hypothetical protein H6993_07610 [Pseudomonadales bacterium]|nr:hypothetical protein [Pseudomonadales bacterium]MCP5183813.1 hypothetical protein [Pseudomonadales bacterium]
MPQLARVLNETCYCAGTDIPATREALRAPTGEPALTGAHAHLFSPLPVFVPATAIQRMRDIVRAVHQISALPAWRSLTLPGAPGIAGHDPACESVFMGFDFHLGDAEPRLIEINTNAGGALLTALASRNILYAPGVDVSCLQAIVPPPAEAFVDMFSDAFRSKFGNRPLRRIAIVDDTPGQQYLYPEFLLFQALFQRAGIDAVIADAAALVWRDGVLSVEGQPVDLVYNRLTDFYLEKPTSLALRQAYLADAILMTPHPRAHALLARKSHLARLGSPAALRALGVSDGVATILAAGIPETIAVRDRAPDWWWARRREWFFKPESGFGGRGAYRGAGLTRATFEAILDAGYIAQRYVPAGTRNYLPTGATQPQSMKVDLRCFVHAGEVLSVAARVYRGQTTNFRTQGGGFAQVFIPRED